MVNKFFRWWASQFHEKVWQDCVKEWHTYWSGFSVGFTFRDYGFPLTSHALEELEGEEHYFHIGRAVGLASVLVVIASLIRWVL